MPDPSTAVAFDRRYGRYRRQFVRSADSQV